MTRCPQCRMNMLARDEDIPGRVVCWACGHVVTEGRVTVFERMASNATPEHTHPNESFGLRLPPVEAPKAVVARVIAAIRAEAARG